MVVKGLIYLLRVRDRTQWKMSDHFLIGTFISFCKLDYSIQNQYFSICRRLRTNITIKKWNFTRIHKTEKWYKLETEVIVFVIPGKQSHLGNLISLETISSLPSKSVLHLKTQNIQKKNQIFNFRWLLLIC